MKKSTRILALALTLVFSLGLLTGCGTQKTETPPETTAPEAPATEEKQESQGPVFVNLAGASSSGTWFIYLNAIATYLIDDYGWTVSCESTSGTPEIIELLGSGDFDFAFANGVNVSDAYKAENSKEGSDPATYLRSICYTYGTVQHLVCRNDLDASSIKDLKGSRVCVGVAGSNTEITFKNLLNFAGITYDDITPEYIDGSQAIEALRNGQVDAAIITGPLNNANMTDVMSSGDYRILDIPADVVDGMAKNVNSSYYSFTIPAGTYNHQDKEVVTMGTPNILITHEGVDDEIVYKFLQSIYKHQNELVDVNGAIAEMSLENVETGLVAPLHDGAVKFFTEQGVKLS